MALLCLHLGQKYIFTTGFLIEELFKENFVNFVDQSAHGIKKYFVGLNYECAYLEMFITGTSGTGKLSFI